MGSMGGSRHLKSIAAPRYWPILRKEYKWVVKPSPGPHAVARSIPLLLIVRDVLRLAKTGKEARRLIAEGYFKIDGKVRRNYKFPVGMMDVIEVVGANEYYRVVPVPSKVLDLVKIDKDEASFKLARIEDKTTVKDGHIQLNLHDGRNILIRVNDPRNPVEDVYDTLGVLQISVPGQEVLNYIPLKEGVIAIISGGRNVGRVGKIVSIHRGMRRHRSIVTIEDKSGARFQTSLDYIFPIGLEKPLIKLPEGAW
ncbi:MAG: 30S ribosomal protein S4e [Thermosphaera sp.]